MQMYYEILYKARIYYEKLYYTDAKKDPHIKMDM